MCSNWVKNWRGCLNWIIFCCHKIFSTVFVFDKPISCLVPGLLQCVFCTCCNPPALRRNLLLLLQVSTLHLYFLCRFQLSILYFLFWISSCFIFSTLHLYFLFWTSSCFVFLFQCSCLQGLFPKGSPQASQVRASIMQLTYTWCSFQMQSKLSQVLQFCNKKKGSRQIQVLQFLTKNVSRQNQCPSPNILF